jgi:hypothetical protein
LGGGEPGSGRVLVVVGPEGSRVDVSLDPVAPGDISKHLRAYLGEVADEVLAKAKTTLGPDDFAALSDTFGEMPF